MNYALPRLAFLAVVPALLLLSGCPPSGHGTPRQAPGKTSELPPSLQFKKTTVGLPSKFIGVVGQEDYGIAGAADANLAFFAVKGEKGYEIHRLDLASAQTDKVTDLNDMFTRSLTSDPLGKRLIYTRLRTIGSYVDNPAITKPAQVGIITSYDVDKKEATDVFDFREGDWLHYRGHGIAGMMSTSGERIAALSFDVDRDMAMHDLDQWLEYAPQVIAGTVKEKDKDVAESRLHEILAAPHVYPLLTGTGIEDDGKRKFTSADVDKVRSLRQTMTAPQWAMLVSDRGQEPKLIKLKLPGRYALNPVSLLAVGDHTLLLGTEGKSTGGFPEAQLMLVDESTGEAKEFSRYVGTPQIIYLDTAEENVLVSYLAYDIKTNILSDKLSLRTIPIANPDGATEVALYPAVPDAFAGTTDPKTFAVQSAVDHTIYFSKAGSGPEPVAKLLAPVDGMFMSTDANHLVYTENGMLFQVDLQQNAEASNEWVSANQFSTYDTLASAWLTKLGYHIPADVTYSWEERDGLGAHEISGLAVSKGMDASAGALLRFNVDEESFESLFFPGTPWPNANLTKASVDAPEAEKRANALRVTAGWLSDEAEKYQPGANPLYDGNSATYVLIFHDGYLVDTPKGKKTAVNGEVTVRVHKPTGQVVELNVTTMPEVKDAKFKVTDNDIKVAVRNKGRQAYPESAPIRIDVDGASLIVARDKKPQYGPAEIQESGDWRLAWAVNTYIQPEDELILTSWVDVENGDVLGELNFLPTSQVQK
jgi:hypothetical protein